MSKKTYVFDANAILDYVLDGPGAGKVERLLNEASCHEIAAMVSVVNWGEVFYSLWKENGEDKARNTITSLSASPLQIVTVDVPQALKAGEIKAVHKIPFVDCIAAALTLQFHGTLVTSDRHFEKLGRRVPILWISGRR